MRIRLHILPFLLSLMAPVAARAETGRPLAAMTFTLRSGDDCPAAGCVIASGWIGADTAAAFSRFAKSAGLAPGAEVDLRSAGGDVLGALKMGLVMRRLQLDTRVRAETGSRAEEAGLCASACAYVFLGGVQRRIDEGARLGVHQFWPSLRSPNPSETQRVVGLISSYLEAVGGHPKVQQLALMTPPDSMHWLSPRELVELGVVTAPLQLAASSG